MKPPSAITFANGENRVVLLTDGAANLGNVDPEVLQKRVETNRKQGISVGLLWHRLGGLQR